MSAALAGFSELLLLSRRMAILAHAQDWDTLAALEQERSSLAAKLPASLAGLTQADARSAAQMIKETLECNEAIRAQVTPWMEHVEVLLAAFAPRG